MILALPSIALAGGPKYTYPSPRGLDDEMHQVYHDIQNVPNGTYKSSSMTLQGITVDSETVKYTLYVSSISSSLFTNWVSYTPTFAGLGTVSNVNFWWKRIGDELQIRGIVTAGTISAATVSMTIPAGLTIDSTKLTSLNGGADLTIVGVFGVAQNSTVFTAVIAQSNDNKLYFGEGSASTKSLNTITGSSGFTSGASISVSASVPIQGWSF